MSADDWWTLEFERQRPRLRGLAHRMLGSSSDAEDAVQETWLRLARTQARDGQRIDNLGGWLTTTVARVSLNQLRTRAARRETPTQLHLPDPVVSALTSAADPAEEAVVADSVSTALLVVLDTLEPAERLAFVLHDVFAFPFRDIAPLLERTPAATRQLASRARRRVQASSPRPDGLPAQQEVVEAFFAAARSGNFDRLVAVLHPDVVLRTDLGSATAPAVVTGAAAVAARARTFAADDLRVLPALVDGTAGVVVLAGERPVSVMAFTVVAGQVVTIDALADPERLHLLDLSAVTGPSAGG